MSAARRSASPWRGSRRLRPPCRVVIGTSKPTDWHREYGVAANRPVWTTPWEAFVEVYVCVISPTAHRGIGILSEPFPPSLSARARRRPVLSVAGLDRAAGSLCRSVAPGDSGDGHGARQRSS